MYSIDAEITAPVMDTEVTDRVEQAIENIFPGAEPSFQHGELSGNVHDLEHFSELLHRQAILDTARGVLFDNRRGDTLSFRLKKQAAFENVVNFVVDDPGELGAIAVRIHVEEPDIESFIDQIAPPTEDGTPIQPDN